MHKKVLESIKGSRGFKKAWEAMENHGKIYKQMQSIKSRELIKTELRGTKNIESSEKE